MGTAGTAASSLWWRLSWQLGLVIVGVIGAVIFGLCVWAATIMSPNIAMEETVAAAIAGAVTNEDVGRLELQETQELIALKDQNPALWYIAATVNGASTSYGTVPGEYEGLAHLVSLFQDADIRGAHLSSEAATIDAVETVVGEVRVLFGGVADKGSPVLALFARAYPIYASLLAVALPAIFFAVPRIVSQALVRVSEVAERAAQIEPRRHGARLPTDGIPKEVVPLVTAFNEALDRLEGEAKKRQRFLIDAAHELRTPIAIMQTRIDGMPEGPERRRLLCDVARLADSAEQLLDFERHDQVGELNGTVDLVEMARTVVADIAPVAIAAGYQISFCSEVGSLDRKGNAVALARAVSNLVRNAIDHCEGRGEIVVSVSGDGAIAVADQGPGIPAEHQELVFAPFYRVTPKSQGTGLGLSLVKQIVDNHHARVFMKSDQQGTIVTIKL
ncbi:sensor histidine kinase [Pseudorhizobium endolithicum]|uniref:histidine kinase n=1 Tax=Pseudorhizobium endolithicum TaxID=1191678 RepID=A0ABM8PLL8_9HYPH|nr:HAMP domain-containing sensor histidine kinase [Pseudorhizobium endolithicum]CAD6436470.1 sensor histidine kinase [Rhizobium sp. Q54]CAD7036701.1 sensor histidine kinase [Pseudorhizobium endolithicum]